MEYPGVRLGQRGGLFDLYQYYLGGGDEGTGDEGPVTTDPFPGAGGGDATNTQGVELSRIKQPTGSPFRSDIPQMDFFANPENFKLGVNDPRYMSAADQIFLQNRADAGEFFYGSPGYVGGAPGNIVQSGPGRQFDYNPLISAKGAEIDPISARDLLGIGDDEDERFSFASLRQSIMDNPLLRGVSAIASPVGALTQGAVGILQGLLPATNERAITERRALDQGLAIDDIGRVAFQDFGFRPDPITGEMKYTALGRDDVVNIFAGLNYNKIDQSTIDKMIDRIEKGLMKKNPDLAKKRIDIINQAWKTKQQIDEDTDSEIKRREYIDREKKREKIQEDLAAAGFGEAGAVGLSDDMDKQIIDDYTYTPPDKDDKPQAPPPKPKQSFDPGGGFVDQGGQGEFGGSSASSAAKAGGGSQQAKSGGSRPGGGGGMSGWGWKDGGLVRKPYSDGGIVDLL